MRNRRRRTLVAIRPDIPIPSGPKWIGLKAHFREERPPRSTDLYFFDRGYCGVQPVSEDIVNACAMVRSDRATSLQQVLLLHPELARAKCQLAAACSNPFPRPRSSIAHPSPSAAIWSSSVMPPRSSILSSEMAFPSRCAPDALRPKRWRLFSASPSFSQTPSPTISVAYNAQFAPLIRAASRIRCAAVAAAADRGRRAAVTPPARSPAVHDSKNSQRLMR